MDTIKKPISEKQARIDAMIQRWKDEKRKTEEEARARVQTPEYQEIIKKLREDNAKRGIIIPEL